MKNKIIYTAIALSTGISQVFAGPTEQPIMETPEPTSGWEFSIEPYAWLTALDGDVGLVGPLGVVRTANVDASFGDIADKLDFAFALQFEARKGPWGFIVDGFYSDLSQSFTPPTALHTNGNLEMQQFIGELYAAYRVTESPAGFLDLYAGIRYNYLSNRLTEDAASILVTDIDISESKNWIDPIIGVRGQWEISEKWFLAAAADIGGFGVNSDFAWSIQSTFGYNFTENISAELGYRYLHTDYDKDNFIYDIAQSGLYTGVKFRF